MIHWIAHYNDGSLLRQSDGATYADIERQRLVAFDLWSDGALAIRIDLRDDTKAGEVEIEPKRLVWRKRHQMNDKGGHNVIHMAGWQRRVKGRNVQSIAYLFETDGAILLGGQFREGDFQDPIVLLEFEKDLI